VKNIKENRAEPNALRADLKECLRRLSEGKGEAPVKHLDPLYAAQTVCVDFHPSLDDGAFASLPQNENYYMIK